MADPDVRAEFIANKGAKRPSDAFVSAAEKKREKRRRQGLKRQSVKQQVREAFLAGVKAERIDMKLALFEGVGCEAEGCGEMYEDFQSAWEGLDPHHTELRSRGHGYRGGMDFGVDAPELIELLCRRHHEAEHSHPMFSGEAS